MSREREREPASDAAPTRARVSDDVKQDVWADRAYLEGQGGERLDNVRHHETRLEDDLGRAFPKGFTKADVEDLWAKHEQKYPRSEQLDSFQRNYADDVAAALHSILERAPAQPAGAPLRAAPREVSMPARPVAAPVAAREPPPVPREERLPQQERVVIQAQVEERIMRPIQDVRTDRVLADDRSITKDRSPDYFRREVNELQARGGKEWDIVKADMADLREMRGLATPEKVARNLDAIAAEREVVRSTDPSRADLLNVRALALAGLLNEMRAVPERNDSKNAPLEDQVLRLRVGNPNAETPSGFVKNLADRESPRLDEREREREPTREVTDSMFVRTGLDDVAGENVVFMRAVNREDLQERAPLTDEARLMSEEFGPIGAQLRESMRDDVLDSAEGRAMLEEILGRLRPERSTAPTKIIGARDVERTLPMGKSSLARTDTIRPVTDDPRFDPEKFRASIRQDVLHSDEGRAFVTNVIGRMKDPRPEPSLEDLLDDDRTAVIPPRDVLESTEDRAVPRDVVANLSRSEHSEAPAPRVVPLDTERAGQGAPSDDVTARIVAPTVRTAPTPDEATGRFVAADARVAPQPSIMEREQREAPTASMRVRDPENEATVSMPMAGGRPQAPPHSMVRGRDFSVSDFFENERLEPRSENRARPIMDAHRDDMLRGFSSEGLSVRDPQVLRTANVHEGVTNARMDVRARAHPDFDKAQVAQARERLSDEPGLQTYKELSRYAREQTNPNEVVAALHVMASMRQQAELKLDARFAKARDQFNALEPDQRDQRQQQARAVLESRPEIAEWAYQQSVLLAYELGMLPNDDETRKTVQAVHTIILSA